MANSYFEPGERRAERVEALFSRIARRYDLINDLQSFGLHRLWKRRVVEMAQALPGQRALDVCCGTGDLSLRLAARGTKTIGLDFTAKMLEVAEARHTSSLQNPFRFPQGSPDFSLLRADAQNLPFLNNTFDIVTVGYGLRNLADWEAGLKEMLRVARPGGRLVVLEFGKPNNAVWRFLYFSYLKLFVPFLGLVCCGSPAAYGYILESLKHYPAQEGVAEKMRELGLVNVKIVNLLAGVMSINYGEKGP